MEEHILDLGDNQALVVKFPKPMYELEYCPGFSMTLTGIEGGKVPRWPNWFHRTMTRLLLGWKWRKLP